MNSGSVWRTDFPATLDAVEEFCAEFHRWRASKCAALNQFAIELVIREALTNSVIHGCASDPGKRIWCAVRVKQGRLLVAIRDEGKGFDWRVARNRQAGPQDTGGRGLALLKQYADLVRFNSEGNSITLIKRF
jgi:anti-sigma regulatory factor (Ser/Thr protein kinase)